ncbi:MAG: CRISPR-associated endonuclease Cas2 [Gallionella sp.]|jgi:CRISPR-associated protein Cas2
MPRYFISYDIADPRRLRRVERTISAVGQRVQYSLFLCELKGAQLTDLQRRVAKIIRVSEDSVHYQPLCDADRRMTLHEGASRDLVTSSGWVV